MQPGTESAERIELLLRLVPKFNDATRSALRFYYITGGDIATCCTVYGISQRNLHRSVTRLNEVNQIVEDIKTIDLCHLSEHKTKGLRHARN